MEHSAILSTFIRLPFVIKIFVLSIFEWSFYTGFSVHIVIIVNFEEINPFRQNGPSILSVLSCWNGILFIISGYEMLRVYLTDFLQHNDKRKSFASPSD